MSSTNTKQRGAVPREIIEHILLYVDYSVPGPFCLASKYFRSIVLDLRVLGPIIKANGGYANSYPLWKSIKKYPIGRYFIDAISLNNVAVFKRVLPCLDPIMFRLPIPQSQNGRAVNLLEYASHCGYLEIVQLLLKDGRIDPCLNKLEFAEKTEVMKALYSDKRVRLALPPHELLYNAVLLGDSEQIDPLLKLPEDKSFVRPNGLPDALSLAVKTANLDLISRFFG
jgi:hypothetical protein